MHIQTALRSLPATAGSRVQRAVLSQAARMKKHISSRARIGLRGGERLGVGTVSLIVDSIDHGSALLRSTATLAGEARSRKGQLPGAPSERSHKYNRIRMFSGRRYMLSSDASRVLLRILTTTRARCVCVSSSNPHGVSGDVGRGRNRYMRKRARAGIGDAEKSFRRAR